jgi:hypothetical protein
VPGVRLMRSAGIIAEETDSRAKLRRRSIWSAVSS